MKEKYYITKLQSHAFIFAIVFSKQLYLEFDIEFMLCINKKCAHLYQYLMSSSWKLEIVY